MKNLIISVILIIISINLKAQITSEKAYKSTSNEICEVQKDGHSYEKCIKTLETTIFLIEENIITQSTLKGIDIYIVFRKEIKDNKETYYVENNVGTKYMIIHDIGNKEINLFLTDNGKTYIITFS